MATYEHVPVLLAEVMDFFAPGSNDVLLDTTAGLGGHSEAFLQASSPGGKVVALEADEQALLRAKERLKEYSQRTTFIHTNFFKLKDSLIGGGILTPDSPEIFSHVLFDLGIGSHQLADSMRGFSFHKGQTLAMKFDSQTPLPPSDFPPLQQLEKRLGYAPDAFEVIHQLSAEDLADLIKRFGEERLAFRIAKAVQAALPRIMTAQQLAATISASVPAPYRVGRIHPATRTFQALRIAVNRELEALAQALPQALAVLKPGGKLAVISFHSLEDRIVKQWMKREASICICPPQQPICTCGHTPRLEIITKRPIAASEEEIAKNPRSRSAKLRLARKLGP